MRKTVDGTRQFREGKEGEGLEKRVGAEKKGRKGKRREGRLVMEIREEGKE